MRNRLTDLAYARIKRLIVRCLLAPGEEVTESQLAGRCRLGRGPVRMALSRLTQEGLVSVMPRRGYRIAPVTIKGVQDLFELRLLLEPEAASSAAGRVDADRLRRLDALCHSGYRPGDRASESAFLRVNRDFHLTIARASENERLAEALSRVLEEMERLFHLGLSVRNRSEEMKHEHKALVEALAAGNAEKARRIAGEQIEAARKMVMDAIYSSPSVLRTNIALE